MAQQQLLLVILAVIVIGVAVAVAVTLFVDNATSANRDAVITDLGAFANRAQGYYRKPRTLGGGGLSFAGLTMTYLMADTSNMNGSYGLASVQNDHVVLEGTGREKASNGNPVQVRVTVYPDSSVLQVIN